MVKKEIERLENSVCFDYSHNNNLTIESPSYADFTNFLFTSSFKLGKIQASFNNLEKISKYQLIVIGGPREIDLSSQEIDILLEFVKNGGNLLVINDKGGDYEGNTNLSELTQHFGFKYNPDILFDSVSFHNKQSHVIINNFEAHTITRDLDAIVQASSCTININKLIEADENVKIIPLAVTGLNSFKTHWNGENWIEEIDAPGKTIVACSHYFKGRVIGLSTVSMFSSLNSSYGIFALNNQNFIFNIFKWLLEPPSDTRTSFSRDEKLINIPVNLNLFLWMEKLVYEKNWNKIADIVNFSLKNLKDDYSNIMKSGEKRRKRLENERKKQLLEIQKIDNDEEKNRRANLLRKEDEIITLGRHSVNADKELEGIMASLSTITGGQVGKDFNINSFKSEIEKNKMDNFEKIIIEEKVKENQAIENKTKPPKIQKIKNKESIPETEEKLEKKLEKEVLPHLRNKNIDKRKNVELKSNRLSLKKRADQVLDEAFQSLNSFDDFQKKLAKFKALTDSDEPIK